MLPMMLLAGCGGHLATTTTDQGDASALEAAAGLRDGSRPDDGTSPDATACVGEWCAYYEPSSPPTSEMEYFSPDAVWGSSDSDVWFVGDKILHWDGSSIQQQAAVPHDLLTGVWGTGPSDVWAVGGYYGYGLFEHWDGSSWTSTVAKGDGNLECVWATAPNDAWASESPTGAQTLHWNGSSWAPVLSTTAASMWGSGPDDVWAIGNDLLHWNGSAWSSFPFPAHTSPNTIGGSSASDLWIGGFETLLHWNGQSFTTPELPVASFQLRSIWVNSPTDAWAVGSAVLHWDGTRWSIVPGAPAGAGLYAATGLLGVWSAGPGDAWVVGRGEIFRYKSP